MKYLSLFSGIGGFEKGIEDAWGELFFGGSAYVDEPPTCVGLSEIDKYATQIYQHHYPEHKNYGDITTIDPSDLPDFDLLVGGFPCQAFSIAGKRGGFNDTRGTLFFEIARIAREKQPRLLLLENVKGLLSHDKGDTFHTIISTLDELGYDLQWQVINSKNHGVAQNRERVFIVGHLRGTRRPEVFPLGSFNKLCYSENDSEKAPDESSIGPLRSEGDRAMVRVNSSQDGKVSPKNGVSFTLSAGHYNQPKVEEDAKIRRLTPTECERLQGFPDGWTEGVSDTQRYKTLGNAVTVNVIRDIIINLT